MVLHQMSQHSQHLPTARIRVPSGPFGLAEQGFTLCRRSVNLFPVAQRTYALRNGVVDRPWVVGREFESPVHHENVFKRRVNFLMSRI